MIDVNKYDDLTLHKTYNAIERLGYTDQQILDIITNIQNAGVLFRERLDSD